METRLGEVDVMDVRVAVFPSAVRPKHSTASQAKRRKKKKGDSI